MVDISRLAQSFSVIAPGSVNPAFKVLRDLGSQASPIQTDLRQQSNDVRGFGNSIIGQLQAGNSVEEARGLAESDEISRTVSAAVNAASLRLATVSALNNQRENALLKSQSRGGSSAASAVLSLLQESAGEDDAIFQAIIGRGGGSRSKPISPLDVIASAIKGPKFGEDIFERSIQPLVGAGGGSEVSVQRRVLRDETERVSVNPDNPASLSVAVVRSVADGRYTAENDGFLISGKRVNVATTAVYDTRDPNAEDPRRSSIVHDFGSASDVLFVAGDNDTRADGGEGDDILIAEGNSYLRGGEGNDLLAGQTVFSDEGDDIIFASGFASGGAGIDVIGLFQADPDDPQRLTATGGEGDDIIVADDAAAAYGDEGDDKIILRAGGVALGGQGDDVITAFGRAEVDAGDGDDDIRIGGLAAELQVGGKVIAGAGDDKLEVYGYTDVALGSGKDVAAMENGGVVRFSRGDGSDSVELGETALPKVGEIRKTNTVILNDMMPADVTITVTGFDVTIAIPNSTDQLKVKLASISEPFDLRFEKNGQMQVVRIQNTLQTTGPLELLRPFTP
jgi:Ca2+-binding RTX toxin-like protein